MLLEILDGVFFFATSVIGKERLSSTGKRSLKKRLQNKEGKRAKRDHQSSLLTKSYPLRKAQKLLVCMRRYSDLEFYGQPTTDEPILAAPLPPSEVLIADETVREADKPMVSAWPWQYFLTDFTAS
jgi:hypothetical protein